MTEKCIIVKSPHDAPFQPDPGLPCDYYFHTDNGGNDAYMFKTNRQGECVRGDTMFNKAKCPDQKAALDRIRARPRGGGGKRKRKSRRNKGKSRHATKRKSMRRAKTRKNKSRRSRRGRR